jgi:hypothetical protein
MSNGPKVRGGQYLAGLGGIALIVSLFLKWYTVGLPPGTEQAINDELQGLPEGYRDFAQQFGQSLVNSVSNLGGNAWEAFGTADLALLGCGLVALCATVVALGIVPSIRPDHDGLAKLSRVAGMVAVGIVVVKMFDQPDPSEIWKLASGPYVALGAAAAIAFGGSGATRKTY